MMKNVYFVQVGFDFDGSVYLPYAAGTMIAYASRFDEIRARYAFPDIIYRREKLSSALEKLDAPFMVCFSTAVWNMEYNRALAGLVKQKYPECLTVFGGHSIREDGSFLTREPNADMLMFGEGEQTFYSLLSALDAGEVSRCPNIAYRENGQLRFTEKQLYDTLEDYPSPYVTGVFDALMAKSPEDDYLAVLETNRGCPYTCAYCDWCASKRVRQFPLDKIMAEIDWFSAHKIEYIFCADSNFGIFDRDLLIAQALVSAKKKTGYPKVFRPCYEKNSDERVFRICCALNSVGMDKGATMAYQTLCPEALENIGRKNLTMEHFAALQEKYNAAGIPTYSELILGLPGETKESFSRGICRLLENGQHNSVSVYHCEMLPNARLSDPDYIEKHRIRVIRVPFNHIHSAIRREEEVQEYSYLVRATATLSEEDWVWANLFSVCVQTFHSLGLLRCFSVYLYYERQISYDDFFTRLLAFIFEKTDKLKALFTGFYEKYENSLKGDWNYHNEKFGNVTWFFEEGAFLEYVCDYDAYFAELQPFLRSFFDDGALFAELVRYQRFILVRPGVFGQMQTFDHDFRTYFDDRFAGREAVLQKKRVTLVSHPQNTYESPADYAREVVWFGRRRGATVLKRNEISEMG